MLLVLLVVLAAPLGVIWAEGPILQTQFTNTLDDEIVLIRDNKILIYDPYPLDGTSISWSVQGAYNWRDVAAGDFNGDGDDEIAVINYDNSSPYERVLQIYDPVSGPEPPFTLAPAPREESLDWLWWHVATGDVDADGRDEIVLATYPDTTSEKVSHVFVYDPWDDSYICNGSVTGGYVNGLILTDMFPADNRTEIVIAIGKNIDGTDGRRIYWKNGQTCASLGSNQGNGQGFDVASGDLDGDWNREVVLGASPKEWDQDTDDYKSLAVWKSVGRGPPHWGRLVDLQLPRLGLGFLRHLGSEELFSALLGFHHSRRYKWLGRW